MAAKGTTFLHPCSSSRNVRLMEARGPSLPGYHCKPRTALGRGHLLAVSVGHGRQGQGRAHPPSARVQSGLWPSSFRALRPGGLAGHTGTHSSPASGWLGSNHLPSDLAQPTLWPQRLFTQGDTAPGCAEASTRYYLEDTKSPLDSESIQAVWTDSQDSPERISDIV